MSPLSPSFIRITFAGDDLVHFSDDGLDQRIKIVLPMAGVGFDRFPFDGDWWSVWRRLPDNERNIVRTYTARDIRRHDAEVDVDFVCHGDTGPASAWVQSAEVGDEIVIIGPDSRSGQRPLGIEWNPGDARTVLLAGDETATPAIAAILEKLPQDSTGGVFLEVPSAADILPLVVPDGVDVKWLPRFTHGSPSGYGEPLIAAVRDWTSRYVTAQHTGLQVPSTITDVDVDHDMLWEVPDGSDAGADLYAWLAGEAGAIKSLRRFLVSEVGIDRSHVAFMGYWRFGKSEN